MKIQSMRKSIIQSTFVALVHRVGTTEKITQQVEQRQGGNVIQIKSTASSYKIAFMLLQHLAFN